MKHNLNKKAKCTALILVSSLPFSVEVLADVEKQSAVESLSIEVLAENTRQVINETRDFVSGTQQALIALEKNDTKMTLAILREVSKNLLVILDKNPALALVTAEIETDNLDIEGNANTAKKELKQIDDLLNDEKL